MHALVEAPDSGWGSGRTVGELAVAALLLAAFGLNEARAVALRRGLLTANFAALDARARRQRTQTWSRRTPKSG